MNISRKEIQRNATRVSAHMGGFTLFEYMVTLLISGIAMANSVPSFVQLIDDNRLSSQTNTLVATLRLARSEAVRRGEPVLLCPSNAARTDCGTDANAWENGWLVRTRSGQAIREVPALQGGNQLSGSNDLATGLAFNAMGEPSSSGYFMLCEDSRRGHAREVDINQIGHIRVTQHDSGTASCSTSA